jgi:HD domain-containing protein
MIEDARTGAQMTDVISGITIPDSKLAREAAELVRSYENELLFNHSVRVYVFGAMKGIRQKLKFDSELLYVAALFHDLGLVDHYHTETKRFEVDGADAAREFLRGHGIAEPKADLVWEAIALHTTPEFHNICGRKSRSRTQGSWWTSWELDMTSTRPSSATR